MSAQTTAQGNSTDEGVQPMTEIDVSTLTHDEATQITARIRAWVRQCPIEDVVRAYLGRIWLTAGHCSWREWCDAELGGFRLPAIDRKAAAVALREHGMSQSSIAAVTGAGRSTISGDLQNQPVEIDGLPDDSPVAVTGQDGRVRSYPARKRPKPHLPPVADDGDSADKSLQEARLLDVLTGILKPDRLDNYSFGFRKLLRDLLKETTTTIEEMDGQLVEPCE